MWCPADGPDEPGFWQDRALDAAELLEHWARLEAAAFKRAAGAARPRAGLLRQRGESVTLLRLLLAQLDGLNGLPAVLTLFDVLGSKVANFFEKYGVPVTLAALARLALKSTVASRAEGTDLYGADLVAVLGTFMQEHVDPAVVTKVEMEVLAGIGGRAALPSVPDWAGSVGARLCALAQLGGHGGQPNPAAASGPGDVGQSPRPGSAGSWSGSTWSAGDTESAPPTPGLMDMSTVRWQSDPAGNPAPRCLHQHMLAGVHSWAQLLTEKVAATAAMPPKALALGACALGLIAAGLLPSGALRPPSVPDELWEESMLFKVGQTANKLTAGGPADGLGAPSEILGALLASAACCTQDELRRCAFEATRALQVAMEEGCSS
ncbi:unnamed protein product [Prorocentrum cordatum]|uniref:Uncharacterized protein n=1 Tax=Prorocentrum cordatum TaxID=2364126 RepID=A0ABN9VBL6_9DINO|nr:unnamed protein product [Polarella glacialis]